jgi:hypothetical protein
VWIKRDDHEVGHEGVVNDHDVGFLIESDFARASHRMPAAVQKCRDRLDHVLVDEKP